MCRHGRGWLLSGEPPSLPKTAVTNFQQDGHMAMRNPRGRINYEPNSWGGPPSAGTFTDAFAHCKYIGYCEAATALFDAVGLGDKLDAGFIVLSDGSSVTGLLDRCATLRYWDREAALV